MALKAAISTSQLPAKRSGRTAAPFDKSLTAVLDPTYNAEKIAVLQGTAEEISEARKEASRYARSRKLVLITRVTEEINGEAVKVSMKLTDRKAAQVASPDTSG